MVSNLHPDILSTIFEWLVKICNQKDLKSLYQCILVNKHWCESTVPVLWSNPFRFITEDRETIVKVILMYIACLDKNKKKELFLGMKTPKEVVKTPTFDYPSFLKHLNYWELVNSMNETARYLSNVKEFEFFEVSDKMKIFKVNDTPDISAKLQSFVVDYITKSARINSLVISDHYGLGFTLESGHYEYLADARDGKFFNSIRKLEITFDYQEIYEVFDWLPSHCKNVEHLKFRIKHYNSSELLKINKFINKLRDLKKFKFRYLYQCGDEVDCVPSILKHVCSLQVIEIRYCHLKGSKIIEEIAKCKDLQALTLLSCEGLDYRMAEPLITADLPKFDSVELIGRSYCKEVIEWAKKISPTLYDD